ncbi:MAG TPA: Mpo1-like protein [Burkholderiaceae bacterium]|nr:Mpo1-like protein [Burkholderiaceae bacterium]
MRSATDMLVRYAEFHRDPRNIAMHCIGVPIIVFALGMLLSRPGFTLAGFTLTPAWGAFVLAALWYVTRGSLTLGTTVTLGTSVLVLAAHRVSGASGTAGWFWLGMGCFVIGWIFQLLGHYYEGRKAVFVTDLVSLLVGPMFVAAQALFAMGWNPALQQEIIRRAGPTRLRDLAHPMAH